MRRGGTFDVLAGYTCNQTITQETMLGDTGGLESVVGSRLPDMESWVR